jgi:protein TonB
MDGDRNGATKAERGSPYRRAAGSAVAMDPMSRVLATGPRLPVTAAIIAAILLHVGMAGGATAAALFDEIFAWQRGIRDIIAYRLSQYEMDIIREAPPPPPPPPPEETKPEPEPPKPVPKDEPPPPPPTPAEAAKVLTSDPDPKEPVDLTGGFVTGEGNTYAGGQTSANGTSKQAVYNPAAAHTGVPGGTGTAPAPVVKKDDRSRVPGLLGSVDWNDCPFPGEADSEQIDQAFVMIQVKVKADGTPDTVTVLQDPQHGFGREARKCAMRKKYAPGLDADGNAISGLTKPFRVRFER